MRRLLPYIIPVLFFGGCRAGYVSTAKPASGTKVEKTVGDARMEKIIAPYRVRVNEQLAEKVGTTPAALEKGLPESELSNMMADAALWSARTWAVGPTEKYLPEMCMLNSGGIRTALPAGTVTMGHIYELMPFENEIVLLKLSPDSLRSLVKYIAEKGGAPVSGIRMHIGGNVAGQVQINGQAFAFDRSVWVATSDFLAYGGDGMTFFSKPLEYVETKIKVRDAIAAYFKRFYAEGKPVPAVKDGRISR